MAFRQVLAERLPFLRRYARALTGSQRSGDAYVRELLEAALSDEELREELVRGRVELYRAFSRIWSHAHVEVGAGDASDDVAESIAEERLGRIPAEHRQALLLTTLEGFSEAETGEILGLEAEEVRALVARAIAEIDAETATTVMIVEDEPLISMQLEELVHELGHTVVATATTVMIVEDEPLISMQLEELVHELGHTVVATATTRSEAVEAFGRTSPSLLLVDIQLADSSSGIDTVEDILKIASVPVIFITAYPERLLTGQRPEPTYLVTKPFQEDTVRATISQALFFGSTEDLG